MADRSEEQALARRIEEMLRAPNGPYRTAVVLRDLIEHLSLYSGTATPAAFFLDRDFIGERTAEAVRARVIWNLTNAFQRTGPKPQAQIPTGENPAFSMLVQPSELYYLTYLEHRLDAPPDAYVFGMRGMLRALLYVNESVENPYGIDNVYFTADTLLRRQGF